MAATDASDLTTATDDRDSYRTDDAPAFDAATEEALRTPVNPEWCELKPAGNRDLVYVPWMRYQQVLVAAFGIGGFRLVPHPKSPPAQVGNFMTYRAALFVRPRGGSKFVYVGEATGSNQLFSSGAPGDAIEGAMSDCLTKCCKRLNIFSELFDPEWRRRYDAHFKRTHQQMVGKPAPLPGGWKAAADGSAQAGRPAPKAPTSAPAAAPVTPVDGGTSEPSSGSAAALDTGEALSAEGVKAIRDAVKRLTWKPDYARKWLTARFGVSNPEALSQQQGANAYMLLNLFGKPAYDTLLAEMAAKGEVQ